jgi:hypothetical protein
VQRIIIEFAINIYIISSLVLPSSLSSHTSIFLLPAAKYLHVTVRSSPLIRASRAGPPPSPVGY